ncbi:MAG: hypothetical protein IJE07_04010 [Clostridia bacterium]|nr:hypothetical protein [Clostridia bacterium]
MKKIVLMILALLLCVAVAQAEDVTPTATPSPTPVPDIIAQPEKEERRVTTTATPRPADAPLPEDEFIANVVEIARRMDMLTKSSVYYNYCNRSGATWTRWQALTRGDHTTPVRILSLDGESLRMALTGGEPENSPWFDLGRQELRQDMVTSLPDVMYVGMDSDDVSTCRSLARYKVYASDMPDDCGLLILLYEDAVPIVSPWYSNEGAVCVCAFLMPDEVLEACQTPEDVSAWFAGLGMPEVSFEEVTW